MGSQFIKMPMRLLRSTLSNQARIVYLHLRSFNPSYPSYERLKELTGFSYQTIASSIKDLKEANLIWIKQGSHKDKQSNSYEFNLVEGSWRLTEGKPTLARRGRPLSPGESDPSRQERPIRLNNKNKKLESDLLDVGKTTGQIICAAKPTPANQTFEELVEANQANPLFKDLLSFTNKPNQ